MDPLQRIQQDVELRRLTRAKLVHRQPTSNIGSELVSFYRQAVKRTQKLGGIGQVWLQLVPPHLVEHCSIDGFSRGILTVTVDSSPHLYQLKQLLLAGLQNQLITACRGGGLKKVVLKAGPAASEAKPDDRRMKFDE